MQAPLQAILDATIVVMITIYYTNMNPRVQHNQEVQMSFNTPAGTRGARSRGSSGAVSRWVRQRMMRQHRRKGWKFMGMDVLFLTTVGSKTGQERITPVAWFPYGDGTWLIVASAAGSAHNPAWYHNIATHPDRLQIELPDRKIAVTAEQLTGPAREEAFRRIAAAQPRYAKYQKKTDRELPVIHLVPKPS
jgi:deazaflavin-dependent oxidoreductase (nitroreductase family)